jgi:hypothetical protein
VDEKYGDQGSGVRDQLKTTAGSSTYVREDYLRDISGYASEAKWLERGKVIHLPVGRRIRMPNCLALKASASHL